MGDPVPDGAVVFPGCVGDGLPEAVPDPGVAGMYDWYSGSVESRTGSCSSADLPVESSLTRTVTMEPGDPVVGSSIMAGGWAKDVSPLALTGIDTCRPGSAGDGDNRVLGGRVEYGAHDPSGLVRSVGEDEHVRQLHRTDHGVDPVGRRRDLRGFRGVVGGAAGSGHSSTPSVRAAIADLIPASRVVGATAGSSRQKLSGHLRLSSRAAGKSTRRRSWWPPSGRRPAAAPPAGPKCGLSSRIPGAGPGCASDDTQTRIVY